MENSTTAAASIRKNGKGLMLFASVFMALTVGSFGVGQCVRGQDNPSIVLKNWNDEITAQEQIDFMNEHSYLMSSEQARSYLQAMMIDMILMRKAAVREGIVVDKEAIRAKIINDPKFKGEDSKFDPAKYEEYIGKMYQNIQEVILRKKYYEASVKGQLLLEKLRDKVEDKIIVTNDDLVKEFKNRFDTIDYQYVEVPVDFAGAPNPTKEDIEKRYGEVKGTAEYQTEKQAKVTYLYFPYTKFVNGISITEKEAKTYYEGNKEIYVIKDGNEKDPEKKKYEAFSKVKEKIIETIKSEKQKELAIKTTDELHVKISGIVNEAGEVDLEKALKEINPENAEFGKSGLIGATKGGLDLIEKAGDITALRTIMMSKIGQPSVAKLNLEKGVLLYRVLKSDVEEARDLTLEEAQDKIIQKLKKENGWNAALIKAEALKKDAETNGFEKMAETATLAKLENSVAIDKAAGKAKTITDNVVDNEQKENDMGIVKVDFNDQIYIVYQVKTRKQAANEVYEKEKANIETDLLAQKKAAKWSEYTEGLSKDAGLVLPK